MGGMTMMLLVTACFRVAALRRWWMLGERRGMGRKVS